ncbi:hypothetical protein H5410_000380 [Solanum commersonii]|uniref:U-box domain-containing protein n=1 Tax=Solanum commersonii TaxID=4109 RepID=A0A9J6AX20_SOLCO|nr:hypothetical protein H5410_000380 [Solanum commersonii]
MLVLLDQICQSAEGRAELLNHPGGLAIVSKKILRVSKVGSERAIKILHSISKFSSTPSVVQEMLSLGVVAKLCLVLQVDCGKMMKDPVTISTGITYDRENIEKWIFSAKNNTCPATKQSLTCIELTPNVTLRRFIQSWCTINESHGIERFPTPKPPVSKPQIIKLLKEAKSPKMQMKSLKRLRSIASENDANKRCMESAGAMEFLASIINNNNNLNEVFEEEEGFMSIKDEALSILYQLKLSEQGLKSLIVSGNGEFIESLTRVMQHGSYESRAYAVMLMKDMFEVSTPTLLLSLKLEFFTQVVQVLRDEISQKATKASLQVLVNACPFGRNRVKAAVEAGAIKVLVDLLLDSSEKRVCELMIILLDQLCQSAEGRAELLNHPGGLAIVSKKILRVSKVGSERAIKILHSISKFSSTPSVVQEMLSLGVVAKLCLVLQVDCGSKAKERAREILKFHAKAWRNSPCVPNNLSSSYPF